MVHIFLLSHAFKFFFEEKKKNEGKGAELHLCCHTSSKGGGEIDRGTRMHAIPTWEIFIEFK
jgi:hypothetical protein